MRKQTNMTDISAYADIVAHIFRMSRAEVIEKLYLVRELGDLILVSYNDRDVIPLDVQEIRGVVIDTLLRVKVTGGSEYTEIITLKSPKLPLASTLSATEERVGKFGNVLPLSNWADEVEMAEKQERSVIPESSVIRVYSESLDDHVDFDPLSSDVRIRPYCQGTVFKLSMHGGDILLSGLNNLDLNSELSNKLWTYRWDTEPEFRVGRSRVNPKRRPAYDDNVPFADSIERIFETIGLSFTDFFPVGCLYSPWCYTFMLTMPYHTTATRMFVPDDGFITFLRKESTWLHSYENSESPFVTKEEDAVDNKVWMGVPDLEGLSVIDFFKQKIIPGYFKISPISNRRSTYLNYPYKVLSLNQANDLLRYGTMTGDSRSVCDDCLNIEDRAFFGESVILTKKHKYTFVVDGVEQTRTTFYSVKLYPPAYKWRSDLFEYSGSQSKLYDLFFYINGLLFPNKSRTAETIYSMFPLMDFKSFSQFFYTTEKGREALRVETFNDADSLMFGQNSKNPHSSGSIAWVVKLFLDSGRTMYPNHPVKPATLSSMKDFTIDNLADVIFPYFVALVNPSRQSLAIQAYKRFKYETEKLVKFISEKPSGKWKGDRFMADKAMPQRAEPTPGKPVKVVATNYTMLDKQGKMYALRELHKFSVACYGRFYGELNSYEKKGKVIAAESPFGRSLLRKIIIGMFDSISFDTKKQVIKELVDKLDLRETVKKMTFIKSGVPERDIVKDYTGEKVKKTKDDANTKKRRANKAKNWDERK